jgi:hypothetical protein
MHSHIFKFSNFDYFEFPAASSRSLLAIQHAVSAGRVTSRHLKLVCELDQMAPLSRQ